MNSSSASRPAEVAVRRKANGPVPNFGAVISSTSIEYLPAPIFMVTFEQEVTAFR